MSPNNTVTSTNEHILDIKEFSRGKNPPKNEDLFGHNKTTIVLSDGATDKSGQSFEGKSGGELAAQLVVETCLRSGAHGKELVDEVSAELRNLYQDINPKALDDSTYRFAATMVAANIVGDDLIVTQVGDSAFRINGTNIYTNNKDIDFLTANARKEYIKITGDVSGSRDFIMPLLKVQHIYQNNPNSPLGYGFIDGTPVPHKFVKTYTFKRNEVHTLEVVSDGYYGVFPKEVTIEAYEALYEHIQRTDPDKCGEFASTKTDDDRTVAIIQFAL